MSSEAHVPHQLLMALRRACRSSASASAASSSSVGAATLAGAALFLGAAAICSRVSPAISVNTCSGKGLDRRPLLVYVVAKTLSSFAGPKLFACCPGRLNHALAEVESLCGMWPVS